MSALDSLDLELEFILAIQIQYLLTQTCIFHSLLEVA